MEAVNLSNGKDVESPSTAGAEATVKVGKSGQSAVTDEDSRNSNLEAPSPSYGEFGKNLGKAGEEPVGLCAKSGELLEPCLNLEIVDLTDGRMVEPLEKAGAELVDFCRKSGQSGAPVDNIVECNGGVSTDMPPPAPNVHGWEPCDGRATQMIYESPMTIAHHHSMDIHDSMQVFDVSSNAKIPPDDIRLAVSSGIPPIQEGGGKSFRLPLDVDLPANNGKMVDRVDGVADNVIGGALGDTIAAGIPPTQGGGGESLGSPLDADLPAADQDDETEHHWWKRNGFRLGRSGRG